MVHMLSQLDISPARLVLNAQTHIERPITSRLLLGGRLP
jgi:hypothetical protein